MSSQSMLYADRFATADSDDALLEDASFLRAYGLDRGERLADFLEQHFVLTDKRLLDLGAGYGALAVPLQGRGAQVVAMDILEQRLRVTRRRGEIGGDALAGVIQGDAFASPALPFADQFFDGIVINGVLEYAGLARGAKPERVQARILGEVYRLLRPGGWVYWAIENRYSYTYFYGPGHDRLWWSSLLPRRVAGWYSRLITGQPYTMCEPSYFRLRGLLQQAGFHSVQVYGGIPNYNKFTQVIDLEAPYDPQALGDPPGMNRGLQMLLKTGLQRYFWTNFMALAQK